MSKATLEIWHRRLGHANIKNVLKLEEKDMVSGMEVIGSKDHNASTCKACSDVCGPMETTARTGHRYFVTYIDGHSHHLVVKLAKSKDEVFGFTKEYFVRAEAETGCKPNYLRSDGGGEYSSKEFEATRERRCGTNEPNAH